MSDERLEDIFLKELGFDADAGIEFLFKFKWCRGAQEY